MRYTTLLLALLICSFRLSASGYELSDKIDLPLTGWNKVLQVSNGNTLLFHFELSKSIVIKVFDKERKEIASQKYPGKLVDMIALQRSTVHGVYEMNNEAVIFISQPILSKETLIRLCFNITTGKLITEQKVVESQSFKKNLSLSLVRDSTHGGYAVFCMKDLIANFEDDAYLEVFDEKHNYVRRVVYKTQRKEYDYTNHVTTCIDKDGNIVVIMDCSKIVKYPNENAHSIVACYLPYGDSAFSPITTQLPKHVSTDYGIYSYDEFRKKLNIFMVGATMILYKNGLQTLQRPLFSNFLLMYNREDFKDMAYSPIDYSIANKERAAVIDSTDPFKPQPLRVYTNKFGLNTLISEDIVPNVRLNGEITSYTYLGDIIVTQINDEGQEIASFTLPKRQFLEHFITRDRIRYRGTKFNLFAHNDSYAEWEDQFISFNTFMMPTGDCYVVYNDHRSNFGRDSTAEITPVSNYRRIQYEDTDAFIYRITKKREVTKEYLLEPIPGKNYAALVEGADYNNRLKTYAAVVVENEIVEGENNKKTLKLAWKKISP